MYTPQERASLGGFAAALSMSPEQKRERARKAHFTSAVNSVVNRAPELSPEQLDRLQEALTPLFRAMPSRGSDVG